MKTQTSIPAPDGAEIIRPSPPLPSEGRGKRTLLALGAMIGMSLLFGASFVGTKFCLQSFTTSQLVFLRFALAAALFAALTPWIPSRRIDRRNFWRLLGLALLQPVLYFFLEVEGLQRTLASTASVLITTIPLFVMAIEAIGLKTRILAHELLLVLISLVGLTLLLTAHGLGQALGGSLVGNLLILAAAVTSSFYTVLARRTMAQTDALTVTRLQAYWASLCFLPFALRDWLQGGWIAPSSSSVAALAYLGIGCSFLAFLLLNFALSQVKTTIVASFANLTPVVATLLAVALLGEQLLPQQIIGGAIVLSAVALLTVLKDRKP